MIKKLKNSTSSYGRKILFVFIAASLSVVTAVNLSFGEIIVGFGDSITKGTPYVEEDEGNGRRVGGYEPDLEALLENEGKPSSVYNWGVGGESTNLGVSRIEGVIERYDDLDFVLIMEGTNDIGVISVAATISNLSRMIEICRDNNVEPILATLTPDTKNVAKKEDAIPKIYNPRIRELADAKKVILADQYEATVNDWETLTYDGAHPNTLGYQVLAKTWESAILLGIASLGPRVKTLGAIMIDNTSAILNGSVNPNQNKTFYYFEYGPSEKYSNSTDKFAAGDGDTTLSVSAGVNGLTPEKTYHYRIVADSENGTSYGEDRTFTAGLASDASINTAAATDIGTDSARLNGSLYPGGVQTKYYFEYGTDTNYGQKTKLKNAGSGNAQVQVSEEVSGLENKTTYHYRLVAQRNNAKEFGNDRSFKTGSGGNSGGSSGCFITTITP